MLTSEQFVANEHKLGRELNFEPRFIVDDSYSRREWEKEHLVSMNVQKDKDQSTKEN